MKKISCKRDINVVEIHKEKHEFEDEILDRPPMTPPLYVGIPEKEKPRNMGIPDGGKIETRSEQKQVVKPSVMEKNYRT